MPLWALILTLIFGAVTVAATLGGGYMHARISGSNSGRLEEKIDTLAEEVAQQRSDVRECQLATRCEGQMKSMGDRIDNAHKRMDRHEDRLNKQDEVVRILAAEVGGLKGKA